MRPLWDEYFIGLAHAAATRSTCPRLHVGAVLVSPDHRVLSMGYNGSPPGAPHCDDVGCEMVGGGCRRTLHAEYNALAMGHRQHGSTLYITHSPCSLCACSAKRYGVARVVYVDAYRDISPVRMLEASGITCHHFCAGQIRETLA